MRDEVLEFTNRRIAKDCHWLQGNCYYFAAILKDRFPDGKIYYDVVYGHFVFKYQNKFYDWGGIYKLTDGHLVSWDEFDEYDALLKQRIIRDCVL